MQIIPVVCESCGEDIGKVSGTNSTHQERLDVHNKQCDVNTQPSWAWVNCRCGERVTLAWLRKHQQRCLYARMCGGAASDSTQDHEELSQGVPDARESTRSDGESTDEDIADEDAADEELGQPDSPRKSVAEQLNRCIATGTVTSAMLRLFCHPSRVDGKRADLEDVEIIDSPLFAAEAPKRCRREQDKQYNCYAEEYTRKIKEAMASRFPLPRSYARSPLADPAQTHFSFFCCCYRRRMHRPGNRGGRRKD